MIFKRSKLFDMIEKGYEAYYDFHNHDPGFMRIHPETYDLLIKDRVVQMNISSCNICGKTYYRNAEIIIIPELPKEKIYFV